MSLPVGERLLVARVSEDIGSSMRMPVMLAHGRAFGSGEHETTCSCLEELERTPILPTARVLDLGSGTGILSVAAVRLGALSVLALDPCPDAIATTKITIRLNGMEDAITPVQGDIGAVGKVLFDLILANLYGDILLGIVDEITSLLAPGGYVLLSGMQYGDTYDVKTRFARAGCELLRERYLDQYTTLVLKK